MRNLKKSLALVLVLAMVLTTVSGAAFSDVPLAHDYSQAIDMLDDLNVLNGYPDGSFKPAATITRAEACAVIYRMLSGKLNADNFVGATKFSDVASNFWGSGYVNYCTELEIVNGYPDGTFLPDRPISYAEMITMLVRAAQLDKTYSGADRNLSYPGGYIAQADINAMNDDVKLSANDAADRGSVAQLVYNTIFNAPYLRAKVAEDETTTIAEYVFKIAKSENIITSVGAYGANELDKGRFDAAAVAGTNNVSISNKKFAKLTAADLGKRVTVYYKKDGSAVGDIMAVVTSTKNNVVSVPVADFYNNNNGNLVYKLDGSEKTITTTNAKVFLNGDELASSPAATILNFYKANKDKYPTEITLISNDGTDRSIEYIFIKEYAFATVSVVEDDAIFFKDVVDFASAVSYGEVQLFDADDEEFDVKMPSSLKKDDKVMVYKDADSDKGAAEIIATETKSAELSNIAAGDVTLGGTKYKVAKDVTVPGDLGESYKFVVDGKFGYIVKTDAVDADIKDYYYVEAVGMNENAYGEETYYAKVYNHLGEEMDITIDNKFVTNNWKGTAVTSAFAAVDAGFITSYFAGEVVSIKINSSKKITGFTAISGRYVQDIDADDTYSARTGLLRFDNGGAYNVKSDTLLFFQDSKGDVKTYLGTAPKYTPVSYGENSEGVIYIGSSNKLKTGIFFASAKGGVSALEDIYGYVTNVSVYSSGSDKAYAEITVAANGKVESIATEIADKDDFAGIIDALRNKFVKFDMTADGKIVYSELSDIAVISTPESLGTTETGILYIDKGIASVSSSSYYIEFDGDSYKYEIADNADVYTINRTDKTASKSSIGTLQASSTSYTRQATVLYDADEEEILAIWYESIKN